MARTAMTTSTKLARKLKPTEHPKVLGHPFQTCSLQACTPWLHSDCFRAVKVRSQFLERLTDCQGVVRDREVHTALNRFDEVFLPSNVNQWHHKQSASTTNSISSTTTPTAFMCLIVSLGAPPWSWPQKLRLESLAAVLHAGAGSSQGRSFRAFSGHTRALSSCQTPKFHHLSVLNEHSSDLGNGKDLQPGGTWMPASAARSKLSLEAAGAPCQGRSNMASEGIIWATLPFGKPTQEWNQIEILQGFWNLRVGLPAMCILASVGLGTKATVSDTRPAEPATMMPRISGYCCRCNWLKSEISSNIKLCVGKLRTHHMDSYGSYIDSWTSVNSVLG